MKVFLLFVHKGKIMILLKKDETLEDLQINKVRMIQKINGFRFGEDSVLLANYISQFHSKSQNASRNIIDLGCNCGSITLLLSQKLPKAKITGVEITLNAFDAFKRNILLNGLSDRVSAINSDWNHLGKTFKRGEFDCVVSNPPYKISNGIQNSEIDDLRIAREEIFSDSRQLFEISNYLLKPRGTCFFIYRTDRLADIIFNMKQSGLEPKKLKLIMPYAGREPTAFIIAGQKGIKPGGFVVEKPFVIFDKPGEYSDEIITMYGKQPLMCETELYQNIKIES